MDDQKKSKLEDWPSIAWGNGSFALIGSIAIGRKAKCIGKRSVAIGHDVTVIEDDTCVIDVDDWQTFLDDLLKDTSEAMEFELGKLRSQIDASKKELERLREAIGAIIYKWPELAHSEVRTQDGRTVAEVVAAALAGPVT